MTLAGTPTAFLDPWFWWDRAADCMIPPKLGIFATKTCGMRWAAAEPRRQPRDQGCAETWCVIAGRTRWVLVGTDAGVRGNGPMLQCAGQTDARAATDRCLRPVASSDASVPSRMIRRRAVLERQQLRRHAGDTAQAWPETRVTTLLNIMSLIGSKVLTFDHVASSSTAPRTTSTHRSREPLFDLLPGSSGGHRGRPRARWRQHRLARAATIQ
jgi:hypothetical protein